MNTERKTTGIPRRLLTGMAAGLAMLLCAPLNAAVLKDVSYTTLPGNRIEVRMTFDGEPPESRSYSIEQPARVALDLLNTTNEVAERHHELRSDLARSATVVEAQERTRLIVNLTRSMGYETSIEGNDLVLVLGGESEAEPVFEAEPRMAEEEPRRFDAEGHQVEDVDFRRGDAGEGQVRVSLSRSAIPVDVREQAGRIHVRFMGTSLPEDLMRRMDVQDFGTPVRHVDTRRDGDAVEMVVHPEGEWEYMAYQADRQFTVNVRPVTEDEPDRRRDEFQFTGEELSLNFQDIEVRSVLQLIADFTGMNLVASDTVTGSITLRLQNVPWDQALDLILRTKGLDKRQSGNVLLIAPADEIAAREQLELESQKQQEQLAPLRSEYIRINYARAGDMESLIKEEGSILSERGGITVDDRTNTLIVQDTERNLEQIRDVIRTLDIAVQQVLIEARVVVATSDLANELGVRWGGLALDLQNFAQEGRTHVATGRARQVTETGAGLLSGDDIEIETPDELMVDMGVTSSQATRFSLGFVDVRSGILELELSALAAEGHGEVIATPKVLTADQQPAVIASGTQIGYEEATASGATAVSFIEAELRLEVTPRITPDGRVIMELNIHNDSVGSVIAGIPSIDTNRVETTVLVDDGETVVLGGIFQQEKLEGVVKTPFLGDLPWIGRLFRRTFSEDEKQELLVFITPRLVQDGDALASN